MFRVHPKAYYKNKLTRLSIINRLFNTKRASSSSIVKDFDPKIIEGERFICNSADVLDDS